mgnify:CR=1 FL=1
MRVDDRNGTAEDQAYDSNYRSRIRKSRSVITAPVT